MSDDLYPFEPECVYYDTDMKELSEAFDTALKVFRNIRRRADRRESVRVSKSFFDYVTKASALDVTPEIFYDFRLDNLRVKIYRYRAMYGVLCVDCDYPAGKLNTAYTGVGNFYGNFRSYKEAIPLFKDIVRSVVDYHQAVLF